MEECVQPYFILNKEVRDCDSFDIGLINTGTSVYEVIRLAGSKLLFLEDHLERFFRSLKFSGTDSWLSRDEICAGIRDLLDKNECREGNIKIVMNIREDSSRSFLAYFVKHRYPTGSEYSNGVKVITFPFERNDPNTKIWRPEFRMMVAEALARTTAFEALLINPRGHVTEASKANVFAVFKGSLITPPDETVLPGITRRHIIAICDRLGIKVVRRKLELNELSSCEALFLSGTSTKVLPVSVVDDQKIPVDSPVLSRISGQYDKVIHDYLN